MKSLTKEKLFQTQHPNDVMEEWKKLYKMVNRLFEEVKRRCFYHQAHRSQGVNSKQRSLVRRRATEERPDPDSVVGEEGPPAVLPQHLRPLQQRLQLGEAVEVRLESGNWHSSGHFIFQSNIRNHFFIFTHSHPSVTF